MFYWLFLFILYFLIVYLILYHVLKVIHFINAKYNTFNNIFKC